MKKILISILGIIGIFGFVNADGIYWNQSDGLISVVINGSTKYTLQDKNLGASNVGDYGNYYQFGNNYGFTSVSTKEQSPGDLSSYGPGNPFNSNGVFYTSMSSSNWDLRGGITASPLGAMQGPCSYGYYVIRSRTPFFDDISSLGITLNSNNIFSYLKMPAGGWISDGGYFSYVGNVGHYSCSYPKDNNNQYYLYFYGNSFNPSDSDPKGQANSVRCFSVNLVDPDSTRTKLYGDDIDFVSNPKLKINYGNTSYEYDLTSNLDIILDSPVFKSGDIYIYSGNTGLNLFFNNTSQFYNKDKLYLSDYFSYSNNIFTPVCL